MNRINRHCLGRPLAWRRGSAFLLAVVTTLTHAQATGGWTAAQRQALVVEASRGQRGTWGLQQILLHEAALTPEDKALLDWQLDDEQKYAFHYAVAKLEAHANLFATLKPALPSSANAAAAFQFAQAATASAQVAANQLLRETLNRLQTAQVRTLIQDAVQRGKVSKATVEAWVQQLRQGTPADFQSVRKEMEHVLEGHQERFFNEVSTQLRRIKPSDAKALLGGLDPTTAKPGALFERWKEQVSKEAKVLTVPTAVLNEFAANPSLADAAKAPAAAAIRNLAAVSIGLQVQVARVDAVIEPLKKTGDDAEKAASDLAKFVIGQNLSAMDAVRAPTLISQITGSPASAARDAAMRALGPLPSETLDRLQQIAASTRRLEVGFGGWTETGKTLTGIAELVGTIDPSLIAATRQVASLVETASNFINVGQTVLATVGRIQSATSAIATTASLATSFFATGGVGPVLSLLGGLGGLFGGGSNDGAVLQQLEQVNRKLDALLENQRRTLEAIAKVSEQLQAATNTIVREIEAVSTQVTRVENAVFKSGVASRRSPCLQLYQMAGGYGYDRNAGTFPAGERLHYWVDAFEIGSYAKTGYMSACRQFLAAAARAKDVTDDYLLDGSRDFNLTNYGSASTLPAVLLRSPEASRYLPMRDLTVVLSGDSSFLTSACMRQAFLPQALGAPRRFADVYTLSEACAKKLDLRPPALLDGELARPSFVFQQMLHEGSVRELAVFVDFFAPLLDMDKALTTMRATKLPWPIQSNPALAFQTLSKDPPSCQPEPTLGRATQLESEALYAGTLTFVNAALAQQLLVSGAAIAKNIADVLIDSEFGASSTAFTADKDKLAKWDAFDAIAVGQATGDLDINGAVDGGTAPAVTQYDDLRQKWDAYRRTVATEDTVFGKDCNVSKNIEKHRFETVACALESNPTFANNVLQYLMLRHLREPVPLPSWLTNARPEFAGIEPRSLSLEMYDQLLAMSGDSALLKATLGRSLPLVYLQGRRSGWFLHMRKHSGENWYWRLPEAALLASAHVYYPLSEGPLRDAQAVLASRLADYAAACMAPMLQDRPELLSRSALLAPPRRPLAQQP
jgi:hypothetical protein